MEYDIVLNSIMCPINCVDIYGGPCYFADENLFLMRIAGKTKRFNNAQEICGLLKS